MKKFVRLSALVGVAALALPAFLAVKNYANADAYSPASLPTTIDLNDSTANEIRSYYAGLNSLSTSERQGTNLLKHLKDILKDDQHYFSYEKGENVWKMYEITDRDWVKSPASSISGYNPSTNIISGYSYRSSDPYIHALYINRDIDNQTTAWADHQQTQWGINREHVWPKAEGFDTSGAGGARGDPMHLMAGNGYSNNIHSNNYYGYVDTSISYTDCGTKYSNQSGNLSGNPLTSIAGSGTVFEPQDDDKGDIARAIFYMVARYNYLSGSDSDGIDTNNPNLTLTQNMSDWRSSGYTSSTSNPGKMGIMTDLLAWHHADPVSEFEIHRNNLLYKNFTNNRNPFIDFPEWVDFIWGTATYNGRNYQSYSSTPTGYASPSSDKINGYNGGGGETVHVTGVSLNKESTSITVDGAETLGATVEPANATDQSLTWSTSDATVATVSHGTVRGVAEGTATITVTTNDGGYTDTCEVTVTSSGGGETEVTASTTILDYATAHNWENSVKYESINLDSIATATANGGSSTGKYYTSGYEWRFYQSESASITVSVPSGYELEEATFTYNSGNNGRLFDSSSDVVASGSAVSLSGNSATFTVGKEGSGTNGQVKFTAISVTYSQTATVKTLDSILLDTSDAQTTFFVGDEFNYENVVVTANYSDGSSEIITSGYTVIPPDMTTYGEKEVTVSYTEDEVTREATYEITVNPIVLTHISISNAKTEYYLGDEFVKPTVTAVYSNESEEDVTDYAVFSGYDLNTLGEQTVTVVYGEAVNEYEITVSKPPVTGITATCSKTFYVGDIITKDDISVLDSNGDEVTDFNFDSYQFRYEDAASGGALTNKTFTNAVTSGDFACSLTVQVQRKARQAVGSVSDTLNDAYTGQEPNIYADWGPKDAPNSSAKYAGHCAGNYDSIQLRSGLTEYEYHAGIFTTVSGGLISEISVVWNSHTTNSRTLNVYGKNTPYSSANDLYNEEKQGTLLGTIVKGTSTTLSIEGSYAYVGVCCAGYAMYLDSITFTYGAEDTAKNLSNYIMYEDTVNQCETKFDIAQGYFEGLSLNERATFMTSDDYVISNARERLEAWANHLGKSIVLFDGDYIIQNVSNSITYNETGNDYSLVILVTVLAISEISIIGLLIYKRKKKYH